MHIVRAYEDRDKSLLFSTFLKGLYYGNSWFKQIDKKLFMANYSRVLENLLKKPTTEISILTLQDDLDVILGYSIWEKTGILHWIYMKTTWRNMGLSKHLLPIQMNTVTHLTNVGLKLKPKDIIFNPFLI